MSNWVDDGQPDESRDRSEGVSSHLEGTRSLSRRELLGYTGVSVATMTLAGCSGNGSEPQPLDEAWSLPLVIRPADADFNPFARANATGLAFRYEPFARFDQTELTWNPILATDWIVSEGKFELTLAEDREWTNGDQVTADDVSAFFDIVTLFDDSMSDYVSDWRVRDDSTFVIDLDGTETSSRLLRHRILPRRLTVNHSTFGDIAERAATADSASDREAVREELRALNREDLPTNGPYSVSEVAADRIRYEITEAHPASGDDARPAVEALHLPSPSEQWDAIRNNDIDGHNDLRLAPGQRSDSPEQLDSAVIDGLGGNGLFMQYDDEWFGDLRVRRAIACLLDGPTLAAQINGVPITDDGMGRYVGMNNTDLLSGWFADRSDYPSFNQDHMRGASLLSEAGLEKVDGVWMTPDNEPLEAPIKVASSWGVGSVIAQEIARQLGEAGIAADVVRLGIDRFQRQLEHGEYRLAFGTIDCDVWHPYAVYNHAFSSELAKASWQFPSEVEIPMPVGGEESTTVDPRDLLAQLRQAEATDSEREIVRSLGWVFNRTLPWIPSNKTVYSILLTNDHWSYPQLPEDGDVPASLKKLTPTVASNLAAAGTLSHRFESD